MRKRQLSLCDFLEAPPAVRPPRGPVEVWDLFCGAGGFSAGAVEAGCVVAFACDSDEQALDVHKLNHPETTHWHCTLPRDDIPFPSDGRSFHVHGSPPCQRFSLASGQRGNSKDAVQRAESMVEWYIRTALSSGASSWSMEQVASQPVIAIVERFRMENQAAVDWGVFRMELLGVPQTRRRLIAGSKELISNLKRMESSLPRRSVRDAIPRCRGTHIRNAKAWVKQREVPTRDGKKIVYEKAKWTDCCQPVSGPAPTILAHRNLTWVTMTNSEEVETHTGLSLEEAAALQTFPPRYKLPTSSTLGIRLVGNAVPPRVAALLLGGKPPRD